MKPVTEPILNAAANAFDFGGPVVCDARHYGEGHINDTFVVWRKDHSKRFILQRINTDTFTDPVGLMENVCGVTRHLREKILAAGGDPARETLNVIPTLSGAACHLDAEGGAWRAYDFVEDTICLQQVGSEADFRTVAETLANSRTSWQIIRPLPSTKPLHASTTRPTAMQTLKKPLPPMRWAVPRTLHRRSPSSMRGKRTATPCWICWQPVRSRCVSPTTTPRSTTS